MAIKELWYAESGPILYDDEVTGWYPSPYESLPIRGALLSQAYLTDAPENDLEVVRRADVDGTPGTIIKAGENGLPADSKISEDTQNVTINDLNLIPSVDDSQVLGSSSKRWSSVYSGEIRLSPKANSSGPEGTIFYCSTDKSVYVGVEI